MYACVCAWRVYRVCACVPLDGLWVCAFAHGVCVCIVCARVCVRVRVRVFACGWRVGVRARKYFVAIPQ